MNDCCQNCRYWNQFSQQPVADRVIGECLRHAPAAFQIGEDGKLHTKWPTTRSYRWCGDHESVRATK